MLPLHGVGVLVTRPEQQAMLLCRQLEELGATTFRLPALDIKPIAERRDWVARLGTLYAFDLIIFTSANAVRYGASLLGERTDLPLAVIGPATSRALAQAGYRATVTPTDGFDSESLLRHPSLAAVAGRRILLVKGSGGRELLQQQLTERGARVVVADVYRRERAVPNAVDLKDFEAGFDAGAIQVVTATSLEIARNLVELASPSLRDAFNRVHWVVPGARVAQGVRACGVTAPILQAESAEDHELLSAILRWRSSASGA